ncbi:hypothetical protein BU16DRAFT_574288 [Lophium mytilinum]|uniref:Aminoglycoside phosphotransferase domain-containing protein n=1 Tax=Lophium mytilinum TaxID=390894 RepID=A0A6A6QJP2_9PEZI|nr:hypothetical protein BU16DRAFT_574288 [Lophium mytilinum]
MKNSIVPRFATCTIEHCGKPAVRALSCAHCESHLCAKHQSRQFHRCPSISEANDDEVEELISRIDKSELVQIASTLNEGKHCTFRPGKHVGDGAIMGCPNYHAWIDFDDGEKWLVRIPRSDFSSIPATLVEYFVSSEYATLKFLETTKVPAPRAFGFGFLSDPANHVGVNYLLMQALPGNPYDSSIATGNQRNRVLRQFAGILVEISNHPFKKAGSLLLDRNGAFEVAAVASHRFITLGRYGPFRTDADYFATIADQHLDLIADGQLYHTYPKEAFLFYQLLRQHNHELCSNTSGNAFFLKQVNDKGDHLLVDEEHNIVGIIDWQFARTVPACEAFGPSLLTADFQTLYSRNAGVTEADRELFRALQDLQRADLATYASSSELVRRFHIGFARGLSRDDVCEMVAGVLRLSSPRAQDMDMNLWFSQEWANDQGDSCYAQIEDLEHSSAHEAFP